MSKRTIYLCLCCFYKKNTQIRKKKSQFDLLSIRQSIVCDLLKTAHYTGIEVLWKFLFSSTQLIFTCSLNSSALHKHSSKLSIIELSKSSLMWLFLEPDKFCYFREESNLLLFYLLEYFVLCSLLQWCSLILMTIFFPCSFFSLITASSVRLRLALFFCYISIMIATRQRKVTKVTGS